MKKKKTSAKDSLQRSRIIPKAMKAKILPLVTASGSYRNGMVFGLKKPIGFYLKSTKASGVSFGADKKGFFVYTHRARSKSHANWKTITKKEINWIESTG